MTLVRIKHSESTLSVCVCACTMCTVIVCTMCTVIVCTMCTVIVVRETVPMLSLGLLCCILYPCFVVYIHVHSLKLSVSSVLLM